jgi:diguanylate cyclase (GGDEF)-like protein
VVESQCDVTLTRDEGDALRQPRTSSQMDRSVLNGPPAELDALLGALIRGLIAADGSDPVRRAVAHGACMIAPCHAVTIRETSGSGAPVLTLREGEPLDAHDKELERYLCRQVGAAANAVSTLDRVEGDRIREIADRYRQRGWLCLTRALDASGGRVGLLTVHYRDRVALSQPEFAALRTFCDYAALALANARAIQELRDYAYQDPLTGLASRRRLELELARMRGADLSLLLIDFDGLKAVNDSLGYEKGDALIASVGAVLGGSTSHGELAARLGGDEFVIVLPHADAVHARERSEELMRTLDMLEVPDDVRPLFQGASVGSATASRGEDPREVLRRASAEMRSRKRRRKTDRDVPRGLPGEYGLGG